MAIQKIVLNPFNTITLASGNQYNLVAPSYGNFGLNILNTSGGDVALSNASTVSLSDPASYTIPAGANNASDLPFVVRIWGPDGIWVAGSGTISVALMAT